MPRQEPALTTTVASARDHVPGQKLRVAGRFTSYDFTTCLGVISGKDGTILQVNLSLCAGSWIREALHGYIMVTGYLQIIAAGVRIAREGYPDSEIPAGTTAILEVLMARATPELDIRLWDEAVQQTSMNKHAP